MSITILCPFGLEQGLLSKAATMADTVRVLVPERDSALAARYGASHIHTLPEGYIGADEASLALWLAEKLKKWQSTIVLAPATVQMRCIMPMVAQHLQAGLTADCTALALDNNLLLQTRPAFGNSLMATIQTLSPIQMATVRPGTFPAIQMPRDAQVIPEDMPPTGQLSLVEYIPFSQGKPLVQANIIIAGGLGIGSKEGFAKLEAVANKLGAVVAASRSAVDAGFAPYRCQVGITGITVCPKLYIAVGISGAVQHLSGMSGAEKVIAINSDPKAPIFDYADYGIVADWEKVLEELL